MLLVIVLFTLIGTAVWMKLMIDEQPKVHEAPGIPDVEVPDPKDLE
ncbi:MAG: hypothetical protein ACJAT3_001996 [Akkermansiaceae bacterium]